MEKKEWICVGNSVKISLMCSKAMEKACHDPRLMRKLGDNIQQGPWWESSLCIDHEGHSAACHIPITGSRGHARMHLRAVRYEGALAQSNLKTGSTLWENWEKPIQSSCSITCCIPLFSVVLFHYSRAGTASSCAPLLNSRFYVDLKQIAEDTYLDPHKLNELNWVMLCGGAE